MSNCVQLHTMDKMMDKRPIGVFDSGIGGLSILKELLKLLPGENYIFVADQANVPYGEKTKKELEKITLKVCEFLLSKKAKIIVVACNTATCHAIDFLRNNVNIPIIGTVPAIKPAAEKSISGTVGIMSTPATSKSNYLKSLIKLHAPNTKVINVGCLNLEDAVEKGDLSAPYIKILVDKYAKPFKKAGADIIVLGCTHYPFLKQQIRKAVGTKTKLIDSGRAVAKYTRKTIFQMNISNKNGGGVSFYTTGNVNKFSKSASLLLSKHIKAKHISI